jgi:hypothetical protein
MGVKQTVDLEFEAARKIVMAKRIATDGAQPADLSCPLCKPPEPPCLPGRGMCAECWALHCKVNNYPEFATVD